MKNPQPGQEAGGAAISAGNAETIVPDCWSPCQNAAECVASRCRAILDDAGNVQTFECLAHGIFLNRDDAVQA